MRERDRANEERARADDLRHQAESARREADRERAKTRDVLLHILRSGALPPRTGREASSDFTVGPTMGESHLKSALLPMAANPNSARHLGMKAALADIEAGKLKQKFPAYPELPQLRALAAQLKKKYGIETAFVQKVDDKVAAQILGYNEVMRMEIGHRFGPAALDLLRGTRPEPKK